MTQNNIGTTFDDFLADEGIVGDVSQIATKKILAVMLTQEMEKQNLSRAALARKMQTSRAQVQRLLDPDNDSITLNTMQRAAAIMGKQIQLNLI